jgi:hypothetical protein
LTVHHWARIFFAVAAYCAVRCTALVAVALVGVALRTVTALLRRIISVRVAAAERIITGADSRNSAR